MNSKGRVLHARWLLPDPCTLHAGGGVVVEGGRIRAVLPGPAEVRRAVAGAEVLDLGDVLLAPGLVNAHAHLDLTALGDRVPAADGFGGWVRRLLEQRAALDGADLAAAACQGADRLLATGTTLVGDIDSTGVGAASLGEHPLGGVAYREVLDAYDPARSAQAFDAIATPLAPAPGRLEGLSPHAPFTVSPALLARLGALVRERGLPVAVHWSETQPELDWLSDGVGPLAGLLGPSPRRSGLDLLAGAGLLGPGTALIHGNLPGPDEPARIAASGASLVHCPGTHRFFERAPAPLERYLEAGVNLALGTDSRASNEDLDVRREMALLRAAHPALEPSRVWAMATSGGARALGAHDAGVLQRGSRADMTAFDVRSKDLPALLDELTAGLPGVSSVWLGGQRWQPLS